MPKVRIYQLAKELAVDTKEMLDILDGMGVEYKSHSSTIADDVADTVKQLVSEERGGAPSASAQAAATQGATQGASQGATAVATETRTASKTEAQPETQPKDPEAPPRAPVVTVMGHVDHGKTSLLDYIRNTKVAAREAGGITQHIGAYQAQTKHGPITFLDTPGHEAFTAIRQRGANVTDIAVIVVAADDSIMPQTREAIAHAKAARVPIIVAINKTDLPRANVDKVKQDLMRVELVPEDYGGDTVTVPLSALTGDGVDGLLEMISLVAEVEDLRARQEGPAKAVVIESILDKRAGVLATVLVREGQLKVADYITAGETWAKVRALSDSGGARLKEAGPSTPVQVLGFSEQPVAGQEVVAVASEAEAKRITSERTLERKATELLEREKKTVTLADLFGQPKSNAIKLILRADTQGSLEAIKGVLAREATDEVAIDIMLDAVGAPTEADLLLAGTGPATVITFGVNPAGSVSKAADRQGIVIKTYRIIYELIEDIQRMVRGQTEPEFEERVIGHAEVRAVIRVPRSGNIAGSYVTDGVIRRGAKARLVRAGKEVYKGSIAQLRRFKDDVREVSSGFECGVNLQNYENVQEGDIIEAYELVEVPA
ncbi:MAG: translation initiation factor IF-2 [Deinococcota bacterium]|nr:translation initiation factor IF-2 [Deinococcota bacterium]